MSLVAKLTLWGLMPRVTDNTLCVWCFCFRHNEEIDVWINGGNVLMSFCSVSCVVLLVICMLYEYIGVVVWIEWFYWCDNHLTHFLSSSCHNGGFNKWMFKRPICLPVTLHIYWYLFIYRSIYFFNHQPVCFYQHVRTSIHLVLHPLKTRIMLKETQCSRDPFRSLFFICFCSFIRERLFISPSVTWQLHLSLAQPLRLATLNNFLWHVV